MPAADRPYWETPRRAPATAAKPVQHALPAAAPPAVAPPSKASPEAALLAAMSLEEKVGQVMMVGFPGLTVDGSVSELVKGQVGGVCLFKRNIASAEQVAKLNDDLRALFPSVQPFIAVDQEGGNVVRLSDRNVVLPGNMVLGATRDAHLAYEAGRAQGDDLRRLGFNMNLAPVLDVNSNPRNPVIGVRAFSDDVGLVSELGGQFVRGQQAARIVTVAKHFPGHGAVEADSHKGLPVVTAPEAVLRGQLRPFVAAMQAGLDGMMTAHIATPTLSNGDSTPATLSRHVLGDVLRDELGFDGLVLTDELEMDAIDARYGVGHAAVLAINAGADMVLVPWRAEKVAEVRSELLLAVSSGGLSRARLDQAVARVLRAKQARGVFEPLPPREERLAALGRDHDVVTRIASAAVTLLRTDARVFPLPKHRRVAVVTAEAALSTQLGLKVPGLQTLVVPAWPKSKERLALKRQVMALAAGADVVVVGVVNSHQIELATLAQLSGKPVVVVLMGAPYLSAQLPAAAAVLSVYSYQASMAKAAVRALVGELAPTGRLPVAMPRMPFGFGLDVNGRRLPEAVQAERASLPASTPGQP
ncbi:MAG: beta-N-acetylhexosaminidase [Myxococcus sp.]|nr:beta-N-acetylhexosaminidase [Myxococcus sp.]